MTRTVMLFDLRAPEGIGPPIGEVYSNAMEMVRFADRVGFDMISISEHHGAEDNYIPAPFAFAGAVAGATQRIRILLNAVVLPLTDPVRVAENIAVLDLASGGRLEVIFGAGYVPSEFARAGVPINRRGKLFDEGLDLIVRAYTGERFEVNGREVFVRPLPLQKPHPPFYIGGGVEAAAKRAARLGFGFAPMRPGLWDAYDAACAEHGRAPGAKFGLEGPIAVFVTEDPEATWAALEPHVMHVAHVYSRWAAEAGDASTYAGLASIETIRASGKYAIVTPDECVALAQAQAARHSSLIFQPQIAGLRAETGWRSLELFAEKVLPRLA